MKNVAILGANGQVGIEVCLFLKEMTDFNIIPICRSVTSTFLLNKFNFEIRYGDVSKPEDAEKLLTDCDHIVDFTLISGLCSEVKDTSKKIITNSIKYSNNKGCYIYTSSVMAFGMPNQNNHFKSHILSNTVYGYSKRFAESLVKKTCKKYKKDSYILRLGEVHGVIQRASQQLIQELKDEQTIIPNNDSDIVFTFSIAEAIKNIIHGKEQSGLYTLVSTPEWTWEEVHEYYCKKIGITPTIKIITFSEKPFLKSIKTKFIELLNSNAQCISSYLISFFSTVERLIAAKYYSKKAANDINKKDNYYYFPFKDKHYIGKISGKRLRLISDTKHCMNDLMNKIEILLQRNQLINSKRMEGNHDEFDI